MSKLADVSIMAWLLENGIKTETGEPLDFKQHLFLFDIFTDWSPKIVTKKAAQVGWTNTAFLKLCYAVGKRGLDAIYTLPTTDEVRAMVGGKFNRIIAQNPALQSLVKDHDSIEQKAVGKNIVNFKGTWGEREAISHPSDLNVHDEASRSKQSVLELYESRLQHSKYQWQWIFSNPAVKGDLLDRCWEKSDKKEWFVVCDACDEKQHLTWPDSIDRETKNFVCKACGSLLDDETRRKGRWIPTAQGEWSGYHISLLMAPWVSAKKIIDYQETQSAEQFANFVLGEPFIGLGNTVTEDLFWRNLTEQVNPQDDVIIGCDSGIKKHFVCGNKDGLFWYGVTEDWEDVARMLTKWPRSVLVVDAMPDITGPRALRERFRGRVFLNHFAKDRKTMQMIRWGERNEDGAVLSDRNRLIQLVIDEFADKRVALQGTRGDWQDFVNQWLTLFRTTEEDAVGNQVFEWQTSNGNDHWALATAYWRIGMDRFGRGSGKIERVMPVTGLIQADERPTSLKIIKALTTPQRSIWSDEKD